MRPAGEIRLALLEAAAALATAQQAPTMRELACHSQVGFAAARRALDNMVRGGSVVMVRCRRVDYCNRPVGEYAAPGPRE